MEESMRKIELWLARNHSWKLAIKANCIHNRILGKSHGLIIDGKTPPLPIVFKATSEVISYMRKNGLEDIAREYGDIALVILSSYEEYVVVSLI